MYEEAVALDTTVQVVVTVVAIAMENKIKKELK